MPLTLGVNHKEDIIVKCSCGQEVRICASYNSKISKIELDAPQETKIRREPKKVRLVEEGSQT